MGSVLYVGQRNQSNSREEGKLITSQNPNIQLRLKESEIISDISSDSEFEEVKDTNNEFMNAQQETDSSKVDKIIEVYVDLSKKPLQEDDLFADCFEAIPESLISPKPLSLNESQILNDLKRQASEAIQINLSDIKIDEKNIKVRDYESLCLCQNIEKSEIHENLNCSSEKITFEKSRQPIYNKKKALQLSTNQKSEAIEIIDQNRDQKQKTHSKTEDLSEFSEKEFIKKKTDKIERKKVDKISSPSKETFSKSSTKKTLRKRSCITGLDGFPGNKIHKLNEKLLDDEIQIKKTEENYQELAAKKLKEDNSTEELKMIASKLANENFNLEKEKNRQHRMGMTITEKMNSECMELLRLFGVPFIVAPMEAEAQCAFLDYANLTNGTITDDSDIWLFGGTTVYKNFFAQNKTVTEFKYETIKSTFNVDRNKLIQFALLVGSDYTTGNLQIKCFI